MDKKKEDLPFVIKEGDPEKIGVRIGEQGVYFTFINQEDKPCGIILYEKGKFEPIYRIPVETQFRTGNIFAVLIEGQNIFKYDYNFFIGNNIFTDPYARVINGNQTWGKLITQCEQKKLTGGIYWERFDWEGDRSLQTPYEEIIGYQIHVRGFTRHASSKVIQKGTFEGVVEKIPYLLKLGINMLELLPAYEFMEAVIPKDGMQVRNEIEPFMPMEEQSKVKINYWGFARGNYFAPKSSFSATGDAVSSFKNMVKELHKNDISIVMQFYFPAEVSEREILDCICFWVVEYHIDGVHLAGDNIPVNLLAKEPLLKRTKLMYQGFDLYHIYGKDGYPFSKNLAEYNDGYLTDTRKYLKGDDDMLQNIVNRFRRNPEGMAVINYMTNYNSMTLYDCVSYDRKHNEANGEENRDGTDYNYSWNCGIEGATKKKPVLDLRKKQIKNALSFLLLSQGTPLFTSGDERCRTQNGNNNPYCQDNIISWMNWKEGKLQDEIFSFTRQLIALRKKHPILHRPEEMRLTDYISCGYPDISYHGQQAWYPRYESYQRCIAIMYCGKYAMKEKHVEDDFFLVAYNMHWEKHICALPGLPEGRKWHVCLDTSVKNDTGIYEEGKELVLEKQEQLFIPGRTVMVLMGRK